MATDLSFETLTGAATLKHIDDVAAFRLRLFRAFPYLYEGTLAYERDYLAAYATEPQAALIRVLAGDRLVAVATSLPLASSSDIVASAPARFAAAGMDPRRCYYYAEILVEPDVRGHGIARRIYAERERLARSFGYAALCLAVVVRPPDHPLRPPGYVGPEAIWIRDGFTKTGVRFAYRWPTIQSDGSVVDQDNEMVFWVRDLT